jgi:transglutaminase-like putative cysteine protease
MPTSTSAQRQRARRRAAAAGPRTFHVDCELAYELQRSSSFVFQIHALHGRDQQVLAESLELSPAVASHVYLDPLHHHRFLRLQAPEGLLGVRYRATVRLTPRRWNVEAAEMPIEKLPDDVLHHLLPTRYCESDLLSNAAQRMFGTLPPGHARVQAIADWVHDNLDYRPGSSDPTTTARDVFVRRAGVCRDFAHLAITFCRALNIPARLVAGYAAFDAPPPDFHAVFEAYLDGDWVLFDPTRMSPVEDMVRIASGRDAKDVAFATIFGSVQMLKLAPLIEVDGSAGNTKAKPAASAKRKRTAPPRTASLRAAEPTKPASPRAA